MKAAVIGSGGWGTALALVLMENGHDVTLWCRRPALRELMEGTRENPHLKGVILPEKLVLTDDLNHISGCEAVVLAVPSFAVRETARRIAPHLKPGSVLILVSKGIEKGTSLLLHQVVEQEVQGHPVVVLSGPSHAEEIARGVPTTVVASSKDRASAEYIQEILGNETLRIYVNDDITGVELGGALKNIIALCAGICDGMGLGDNAKAALMTRGLAEIGRLGVAMGAKHETFAGLTGVGDLIVTCTSMHSRNRRAGILIGQGLSAEEAADRVGMVVEGIHAAKAAYQLAKKMKVEMPIVEQLYQVICEGQDVRLALKNLMGRAQRHEDEKVWLEALKK